MTEIKDLLEGGLPSALNHATPSPRYNSRQTSRELARPRGRHSRQTSYWWPETNTCALGGQGWLMGPLIPNFDTATWPFLEIDMRPIDMGPIDRREIINDMTYDIS